MLTVCANSKGGVGKSTIAVHLAAWVFDHGFRVGLLDTDKQRSSSQWMAEVEPSIPIRTADTPEECVLAVKELAQSCDFVVGDAPGGLEDLSRTLLILANRVIFPISPSILDVRSVAQATAVLRYAQGINAGRPEGVLVLNKMRTRDTISQELRDDAPKLGLRVAASLIRDLQAFRDAAQQGTVVTRFGRKGAQAATDVDALFTELVGSDLKVLSNDRRQKVGNG